MQIRNTTNLGIYDDKQQSRSAPEQCGVEPQQVFLGGHRVVVFLDHNAGQGFRSQQQNSLEVHDHAINNLKSPWVIGGLTVLVRLYRRHPHHSGNTFQLSRKPVEAITFTLYTSSISLSLMQYDDPCCSTADRMPYMRWTYVVSTSFDGIMEMIIWNFY